ncbi:MAG: hypothetical protein PHR26_01355 [Candidatus ainarchaeum sp.]|nr:hypothetical protein [Candidatus ainarchaeum sp.]MDD3976285.1 hypothetical protein [Candidatus ainarchaeum sp.]
MDNNKYKNYSSETNLNSLDSKKNKKLGIWIFLVFLVIIGLVFYFWIYPNYIKKESPFPPGVDSDPPQILDVNNTQISDTNTTQVPDVNTNQTLDLNQNLGSEECVDLDLFNQKLNLREFGCYESEYYGLDPIGLGLVISSITKYDIVSYNDINVEVITTIVDYSQSFSEEIINIYLESGMTQEDIDMQLASFDELSETIIGIKNKCIYDIEALKYILDNSNDPKNLEVNVSTDGFSSGDEYSCVPFVE